MIHEFEKLTLQERVLLHKAPVLMSVLVSGSPGKIDETQKDDSIRLAHLRTFTAPPLLVPYYREVEKNFEREFESAAKEYFPFDEKKRAELKSKINTVHDVIAKLQPGYAYVLNKSLESYAIHVKKSTHSVFQDFIFPITYSKLIS